MDQSPESSKELETPENQTETLSNTGEDHEETEESKAQTPRSEDTAGITLLEDEGDGGLFGSEDDDDEKALSPKRRKLSDAELDSGDDEGRRDRGEHDRDGGDEDEPQVELQVANLALGRHSIPKPSDGETYILKLPHNIGIEPKAFTLQSFQPPSTEHHSQNPPSTSFSPSSTSNTTIRWRHSPRDPNVLQSNARIIRWTDGSFTLQIASNPMEQYELSGESAAPRKDTHSEIPSAIKREKKATYDPRADKHTYLVSPHEVQSWGQITNHVTAHLNIETNMDHNDEALARLQESMAAAVKGTKKSADGGPAVVETIEDPELAKRKAELAEKEKLRAQRRRQNLEERERDRANRVLGRAGIRAGNISSGLTVGGLEDEGSGMSRARAKAPRKARRRNSEYSDEEEEEGYGGRGRTKEDEYDEYDGFLVRSDEEPEMMGDDTEEEEEIEIEDDDDEGQEQEKPKKKKKKPKKSVSPKTDKKHGGGDDGGAGRSKRRRIVDDDEEDE